MNAGIDRCFTRKGEGCVGGALVIPDAIDGLPVTVVGANAFRNCRNLTSVTLPSSCREIGAHAFYGCGMAGRLELPQGLEHIGSGAFFLSPNLTEVALPVNSVGSYAIPDSVETIWDGAFSDCSRLTEITMPEGLASIKIDAFLNCSGLARIDLPDSLLSIGGYAFRYCTFDEVVLPHRLQTIGNHAFGSCHAIEQIRIPASVSHIGGYAFQLCSALDAVVFEGNAPPSIGTEILYRTTSATLYFYEGAGGGARPLGWQKTIRASCCPYRRIVFAHGRRKTGLARVA